ncbi:MAG TPA: hypothetical protein VGX16_06285, partial [Solirubrobacteraceae bacterium]|nr:hypothetical protein [Solirubrobacteraceae bacterium]
MAVSVCALALTPPALSTLARAQGALLSVPDARVARTLSVNGSARMALVGSSMNTLIEEGHGYGTLSGRVRASIILEGTRVRISFRAYLH